MKKPFWLVNVIEVQGSYYLIFNDYDAYQIYLETEGEVGGRARIIRTYQERVPGAMPWLAGWSEEDVDVEADDEDVFHYVYAADIQAVDAYIEGQGGEIKVESRYFAC